SIAREGSELPVAPGDTVYEGDVLSTGDDSLVKLLLADDSIVSVGARARVNLQSLRRSEAQPRTTLKLVVGRLWARITKSISTTPVFAIEGENAVAGVRGTSLFVDVNSEGTMAVTVENGTVDVTDLLGNKNELGPNARSIANKDGQALSTVTSDDL